MIEIEVKQPGERYTFEELYHLIELLRSPEGCPWDRAQTHESLVKPMIEEAYEAVDAIQKNSPEKLCEELGDVLLQVIFHTILADEEGRFTFTDVTDRCARKMLYRHSHVFGADLAENAGEALSNWEVRKLKEKGFTSLKQDLEDIPNVLPALMRAQKAAKKIRKADGVPEDGVQAAEREIGEKLYAVCKAADRSGVDAEIALQKYIDEVIQHENR